MPDMPPPTPPNPRIPPGPVKDLTLVNARSHVKSVFAFHNGLNVITGDSDCGKSNVIRSVAGFLTGSDSASGLVRRGASTASIWMRMGSKGGITIKLTKQATGQSAYDVNAFHGGAQTKGQYIATGRTVPPEVVELLKMGEVDLGGISNLLNVSAQRGPALIVDQNPGDVARVVGSVSGLDRVYRAVREAESRRKKTAAQAIADRKAFQDALKEDRAARSDPALLIEANVAMARVQIDKAVALEDKAGFVEQDLADAREAIKDLLNVRQHEAAATRATELLEEVSETIGQARVLSDAADTLSTQYTHLLAYMSNLDECRELEAAETKRYSQAEAAFDTALRDVGVCPTCGADTSERTQCHAN